MKLSIISLLAACMILPLHAKEHEESDGDHEERCEEHYDDEDEHRGIEPLGKTLRLEFKAEPDEEDEPLSVIVATTEYGLMVEMDSDDEGFHFMVEGELALVEEDRLGLTFEIRLEMREGESDVAYAARGSTIAKIGGKAQLATLGEQTLYVVVTEIK